MRAIPRPHTEQTTIPNLGWLLLAVLSMIWGGSFLAAKSALSAFEPLTLVALRVGGAATLLWIIALIRGWPIPRNPRIWAVFALVGLFNNALPFSLLTWGQQHIETGLGAILNASTAIFTVLLSAAVFADERLSARKFWGSLLGLAGAAIVIGPGVLMHLDLANLGQIAFIAAAMCYAIGTAMSRAFGKGILRGVPPQMMALGMLSCSFSLQLPLAIYVDGVPDLLISGQMRAGAVSGLAASLFAMGYLAIVATALAYLIYFRLIALVGSGNTALVTLLVTPMAILLGTVVLGEALSLTVMAGFGLLAAGLLVIDGRIIAYLRRTIDV